MTDVRDLLPLYALGVLDVHEAQIVDRACAQDAALAGELRDLLDTTAELAAEPVSVEPPAEIQSQLMASAGAGRFESFSAQLAGVYDVSVDRAREILAMMERKKSWDLPAPGVALVHFDGGPRCVHADCGFVKVQPGCAFPHHNHRGEELTLILSGRARDVQSGRILGPGDEMILDGNTQHDMVCEGDEEVIWAARVYEGIEIGGQPMKKP